MIPIRQNPAVILGIEPGDCCGVIGGRWLSAFAETVAIIAGFPFAIVVFVMMYCLWRGLTRDRLTLYRNVNNGISRQSPLEHNSANGVY